MSKRKKGDSPEVARARTSSDNAGRVFSCIYCGAWTGYPYEHADTEHGGADPAHFMEGFTLVRGKIGKDVPKRPKRAIDQPQLPY